MNIDLFQFIQAFRQRKLDLSKNEKPKKTLKKLNDELYMVVISEKIILQALFYHISAALSMQEY